MSFIRNEFAVGTGDKPIRRKFALALSGRNGDVRDLAVPLRKAFETTGAFCSNLRTAWLLLREII